MNKQNEISANRKSPLCDHNKQFMVFSVSYYKPSLRFKCLPVTTEKERDNRSRTEWPTFGNPPFAFSLMTKYLVVVEYIRRADSSLNAEAISCGTLYFAKHRKRVHIRWLA